MGPGSPRWTFRFIIPFSGVKPYVSRTATLVLLCALCGAASLLGQDDVVDSQMRLLRIPRVTRPPKLADFLHNTPREAELVVTDFRQYSPGDGEPVTQPTTAYLSYDDKNLYAAFVCKDDPKLIRARIAKHDQIMDDDRVVLNIDTFHDHRHMYWFDINPYGVQADGNVTDGVEDDPSWDTLWHTEGRLTADGYAVLAAVPFRSIRFPSDKEQVWGLVLGRFIKRNNEFSVWPRMSSRKPGHVQQGGDLEGLKDISPGRNLQFIPYGLFSRARYLGTPANAAPLFTTDREGQAGVDGKIVLKDAFTLDLTLNPDFSQVESDEPQVTVNQRYEVFFPEKRPFFLDNAGYFKTPVQLFFSRRIVDPTFGARLTGRVGNWSLGGLFADDEAPGKNAAPGSPLYEAHSPVGVFRLQRDFRRSGRNHSVAAMATSQDFGSTYNRVFSLDTRLQLLRNWIFTGQAISTNTRLADGRKLAGPGYSASWRHFGRHFVSNTAYTDFSPNFRSQLGFVRRIDTRQVSQDLGYMWHPEKGPIQSIGPVFSYYSYHDHQGRMTDKNFSPEIRITAIRGTQAAWEYETSYELFGGIGFRQHAHEAEFQTEWFRWLTVSGDLSIGDGINYRPAAGLRPFTGRAKQTGITVTLRPGARWQLDETYIYSSLHTGSRSMVAGVPEGTAVFINHLVRSKANYQFSRRASMRFIADYNSVLPNQSLAKLEKEKRIGVDALFTYMLNPGTALYVGYTDLYENYRLNPLESPELYRTISPDLNTARQFFVKLSYLLRF
jgi:hypothetical protein